jgi:hypothetical protein
MLRAKPVDELSVAFFFSTGVRPVRDAESSCATGFAPTFACDAPHDP